MKNTIPNYTDRFSKDYKKETGFKEEQIEGVCEVVRKIMELSPLVSSEIVIEYNQEGWPEIRAYLTMLPALNKGENK